MIERFSAPAREVVAASGSHSKRLRDSATRTQHLLLGLLENEDTLAARVLAEFGISSAGVEESELSSPVVETPAFDSREIPRPHTVEFQAVLRRADRESRCREDHYVGTGHILLALAGEELSAGHHILRSLGIDFERLCTEVTSALAEHPEVPADWASIERHSEQGPLLSAEDERQLAATVSAGRAARATIDAQNLRTSQAAPELRAVLEAGIEAAGRLGEANRRLAVSIAKDYAQRGHGLIYVYQLASKALLMLLWLDWDFEWQPGARFADYAHPRLIETIEESLGGCE